MADLTMKREYEHSLKCDKEPCKRFQMLAGMYARYQEPSSLGLLKAAAKEVCR